MDAWHDYVSFTSSDVSTDDDVITLRPSGQSGECIGAISRAGRRRHEHAGFAVEQAHDAGSGRGPNEHEAARRVAADAECAGGQNQPHVMPKVRRADGRVWPHIRGYRERPRRPSNEISQVSPPTGSPNGRSTKPLQAPSRN